MFDSADINSLEQQQETLIADSELHRRMVIAEAAALRQQLNVSRFVAQSAAAPSLLLALGTAVGMFAWRKSVSRFRWIPWLLSAWRFGRRWLRW